jgi:hypothetical protein
MMLRRILGRRFAWALVAVLVATGAVEIVYLVCGHRLVEKAYLGQLPDPLGGLAGSLGRHSLEETIRRADRAMYGQVPFFLISNLAVYYALYRLAKWLVGKARSPVAGGGPSGRCFHFDWAVATGIYLVFTCLLFWQHLGCLGTHLIGPPEDNQKQYWNMWYVEQAIAEGHSLRQTDLIFYPEGTRDLFHDYSWYNIGLRLAVSPVLGRVATYNLLILQSFVVAGLAAFLLVRYLVRDSLGAIVGGLVFAFNPSHFAHALHHLNVASIQFLPLFVLFMVKAVRGEGRRSWLWAALFLALAALGHPLYLVLGALFALACYAWLALRRGRLLLRDVAGRLAAPIGLAAVAVSPVLVDMVGQAARHPGVTGGGHGDFVADLAGLVVPHYWHLLGSVPWVRSANLTYSGNLWENTAYLGLAAVVTLAVAARHLARHWPAGLAGLAASVLLSMGTYVHLLGHRTQVILPFSVLKHVPLLAQVRTPGRIMVFAYLALAVLVAAALRLAEDRSAGRRAGVALVALLCALLAADYYSASRDSTSLEIPSCYRAISPGGERFGVLDLPGKYEDCERYMAYQTTHGLPLAQGAVPRKFEPTLVDRLDWQDLEAQRQQLVAARIKYIVIHKYLVSDSKGVPTDDLRRLHTVVADDDSCLVLSVY